MLQQGQGQGQEQEQGGEVDNSEAMEELKKVCFVVFLCPGEG